MQDLYTLFSDIKSLESEQRLHECCRLQLAIRKGHLLLAIKSAVPNGQFATTFLKSMGVLPFSFGATKLGTVL